MTIITWHVHRGCELSHNLNYKTEITVFLAYRAHHMALMVYRYRGRPSNVDITIIDITTTDATLSELV